MFLLKPTCLMNNSHCEPKNIEFFRKVTPVKLTEGRCLELLTESWGLLTDYYLESVKVNYEKSLEINSHATLRVNDISGQVTCLVKGSIIGLLFGLEKHKWREIESLCKENGQLFYRYFKDGLKDSFGTEQKHFYSFCASNQKKDVLVAVFHRCVNLRTKDKNDAFLQITELRKLNTTILDLYQNHLRKSSGGNKSNLAKKDQRK